MYLLSSLVGSRYILKFMLTLPQHFSKIIYRSASCHKTEENYMWINSKKIKSNDNER